MSEVNKVVAVNDNFNPLEVLLEHSETFRIGIGYERLTHSHPKNDEQARAGLKCHDIFLFNNGFCCWIFAIVEQRVSGITEVNTITKNSLFNVNLTVHLKDGDRWLKGSKSYEDIAAVDVVECNVNNGTRAVVAALCVLVNFKWHKVQYTTESVKWFERSPEDIKAGLTVELASEFDRNDMPFRYSDSGIDAHYTVASELAIRKSALAYGFVRVNLVERLSPDNSLGLYEDLYLRKGVGGRVFIRLTIENKDLKWPVTVNTPFTMELQIRKGTEEEKWMAKPYHADITAFYPWAVNVVSGCSLAFLGLSLPIRDAYEAQFFEEAFEDMSLVEAKYTLTRQSLE